MVDVNYKNLRFWELSHKLTLDIYKITKDYPKEEKFSLTSQIRRSESSIPANISEGSGKSTLDFRRFLTISLGSAKEVEYWLLLSKDLEYISINSYDRLNKDISNIIGLLTNYIKKIN
jgi:four helix bundle protein